MEGKDNIKDLFGEKLSGFEANVRPELWANISSQIGGVTSVVSTTGTTLFAKIIIGISVAATVATVSYFSFMDNKTSKIIPNKTSTKPVNISKEAISHNQIKKSKSEYSANQNLENNFIRDYLPEVLNSGLGEFNFNENIIAEQVISPVLDNNENKEVVINENVQQIDQINKNEIEQLTPEIVDVSENVEYLGVLPNVFTPNGDRINDVFSIESNDLSDFSIVVIDKNSKTVYQSTDANFVWDGTELNGEIVEKGMYIYYITARNLKGELVSKHSMLNIETDR